MTNRNPNQLPYAPRPRGVRPLAEIEADLRRPVAAEFIEQKSKGGSRLDFIGWDFAWQVLQAYAPGVQKDVRLAISGDGQQVIVAAGVGVPTTDQGIVWRWATGQDEEDERAYGDAADRGEARALKRAAALFGLFLHQGYEKKGPAFPWDVPFIGTPAPVNAGNSALPTNGHAPTPAQAAYSQQVAAANFQSAEVERAQLTEEFQAACSALDLDEKQAATDLKRKLGRQKWADVTNDELRTAIASMQLSF